MKIFFNISVLIIATVLPLLAQSSDSVYTLPEPASDSLICTTDYRGTELRRNALNIIPLSAVFGTAAGTYEHLFGSRHGLFAEGGYAFGNGYEVTAGYRYHYNTAEDEYGLISPYWGFFVFKGQSSGKYQDPDTKLKHKLEIDMLTIGVHWGQRFAWGKSFNYVWRIGYGYPVIFDLNWPQGKPGNYKTIEKIIKVFSGIDGELSVGIMF